MNPAYPTAVVRLVGEGTNWETVAPKSEKTMATVEENIWDSLNYKEERLNKLDSMIVAQDADAQFFMEIKERGK